VDITSLIFAAPQSYDFTVGVASSVDATFEPLIVNVATDIIITNSIRAYDINGPVTVLGATLSDGNGNMEIVLDSPDTNNQIVIIIDAFAPEWSLRRGLSCPGVYIRWTPPTPP